MTASPHGGDDPGLSSGRSRDDRVLLITRLFAVVLAVILAIFSALLYIWPLETESRFAWPISPAMTPLLMGGGYLAGTYYFSRLALGQRWSPVGTTIFAVTAFATVMAVITIMHWENFTHSHLAFHTWTAIYFLAPPLLILIWYLNRRYDPGSSGHNGVEVPLWGRMAVGALGAGALSLAAVLFIAPATASEFWPWSVSPLTSRVIAGWFTLGGTAPLLVALDPRWSSWRVPMETMFIWAVMMLISVARAWGDFDPNAVSTWLFAGGLVAVIPPFVGFYLYMERSRVAVGQYRTAR